MSTQSINELSQNRYAIENQKSMFALSDAYFYKEYYMLGEGASFDKMYHSLLFNRILCEDNCEIVDYIKEKICGKLDEFGCTKSRKKKTLNELISLVTTNPKCEHEAGCNGGDCICDWNQVSW